MGKKSVDHHLDKATRDVAIYQMHLDHKPYTEIARLAGLSKSRIGQILSDPARIRAVAESTAAANFSNLPLAATRLKSIITDGSDKDAVSAIKLLYEATGIKQAHTTNTNVTAILQQVFAGSEGHISTQAQATIQDLFAIRHKIMQVADNTEVIDIEAVEDDDDEGED